MRRFLVVALMLVALFVLVVLLRGVSAQEQRLDFSAMRTQLMVHVVAMVKASGEETGIERLDPRVIEAMGQVRRHEFVPEHLRVLAYLDMPLPLGDGQNISQPFIIALMCHLARVEPGDIVFETGTGAGYQAAILARLARQVFSVEYIERLAATARDTLDRLGYENVEVRAADGYYGWPDGGAFDAIIVKEAVHHVPEPLLFQLKPGGRLVVPLGPLKGVQELTVIEKDKDGRLRSRRILPVRFAPLQGGERT